LHEECKAAGLIAALIQDAGLTEFGGVPTYTALAVGPDGADRVDAITGALPLL
jgi:PTH2 family peptidyl-tRNA hydrolase